MAIEEKTVKDQRVAIINYKGNIEDMEVLIARLMGWIETEEVELAGDIFAIYYNNVKRFRQKEDIVYDLGIPVAEGQELDDTDLIQIVNILEHKVLSKIHKGPLDNIKEDYVEMADFADENSYDIIGSPKEIYLKAGFNVENPEDMLTEIQLPVIKM